MGAIDSGKPDQLPLASSFFDGILSLLLHVIPKHQGCASPHMSMTAMVEIPEATASLWQRVMRSTDTCDVVFQCPDEEVKAHSFLVAGTSKVVSAMLQWPVNPSDRMEHGGDLRYVKLDVPAEVVQTWKELVYTGLPPTDGLNTELLLDVLDLSHRWQDHLFESGLLTTVLAKRITDSDSFCQILEAALAKDLSELRGECFAFARRSKEVRRDWERGLFSDEISKQLGSIFAITRRGTSGRATTRRWDL